MENLSDLLSLHRDLDEIFFRHQSALLRFDFAKALALLNEYESALATHIEDEERVLLPFYSEHAQEIRGGNAQLFFDEHAKMRSFVDLFKKAVAELENNPKPEADLILLLDREAFFKRLCSHHDKRETEILYPELDRIATQAQKIELLQNVTCAFPKAKGTW